MKLLILLSMIICNACYGQGMERFDSAMKIMQDSNWATMSFGDPLTLTTSIIYKIPDSLPLYHRKRDTVRCLMLICDTSYGLEPSGMFSIRNGTIYNDSVYVSPILTVMYDWGYSVRELHNLNEVDGNPNLFSGGYFRDNNYWKHIYYLDKDKHPIPKNIIIWQSKEIP